MLQLSEYIHWEGGWFWPRICWLFIVLFNVTKLDANRPVRRLDLLRVNGSYC